MSNQELKGVHKRMDRLEKTVIDGFKDGKEIVQDLADKIDEQRVYNDNIYVRKETQKQVEAARDKSQKNTLMILGIVIPVITTILVMTITIITR